MKLTTDEKKLLRLQRQLRQASREIKRAWYKELALASRPLKESAQEGAREKLPQSGGLAERVAKSKMRTRLRRTNLEFIASSTPKDELRKIDEGIVRHPTFGHRPWITQSVEKGWFSESVGDESEEVVSNIEDVITGILRRMG